MVSAFLTTGLLVGGKMDLTEGGIRVPYIVHWPAGFTAQGIVSEQHCLTMDWTVTMLEIAGLSAMPDHPLMVFLCNLVSKPVPNRLRGRCIGE